MISTLMIKAPEGTNGGRAKMSENMEIGVRSTASSYKLGCGAWPCPSFQDLSTIRMMPTLMMNEHERQVMN